MKYNNLDIKFKKRSHNIIKEAILRYKKSDYPSILDVGCASGIIGQLLGWKKNIYGIEKNRLLAKKAQKYCEKVFLIDLDEFKPEIFRDKKFDFIICGDVIEHIKEDEELIKQLTQLLDRGGIMIVSLPNIAQIFFRFLHLFGKWSYQETGVMDKSHLHFYTRETAEKLLVKSKLKILEIVPSGTIVSFINILPTLLASQFVFISRK